MDEQELFERIEDYLRQRMSPEKRQDFEAEIAENPELAEEVELHRALMAATGEKDVLELRKLMEETYAQQHGSTGGTVADVQPAVGMTVSYRRVYRWAAAASLLLVAAAGLWWATRESPAIAPIAQTPHVSTDTVAPGPQKPADRIVEKPVEQPKEQPTRQPDPQRRYIAMAESFYHAPDYSNIRGESLHPDSLPPLDQAKRAFTEKQYGQVVRLLKKPDPDVAQEATYLRGHAFFRLKNYDAAARDFRALMEQESMEADNAGWYLLLSTLARSGAADSGFKEQLRAILDDAGHPYNAKAKELEAALKR